MLRELAVVFPEVRGAFEEFDRALAEPGRTPAWARSSFRLQPSATTAREEARRALMETDVAQPAVGAACVAMLRLMRRLGCEPDMVGGHSFGELVALHAAGAIERTGPGRAVAGARPLHAGGGRRGLGRDGGHSGRSGRRRATDPRRSRRPGGQLERPQADGDRRAEARP